MHSTIDSQKVVRATVITAEVGFIAAVAVIIAALIGAGALLFMIGAA